MPTLSHIAVHPIKALDPLAREAVSITDVGGLAGDRMYAVRDREGNYVNGKRTAKVHRLRASHDLAAGRVTLAVEGVEEEHEFHLEDDRAALEEWLTDYFGIDVELETGPGGSQTDSAVYGDGTETGPTLISRATLEEVASWYDGIDAEGMRLRMRPNLVVEGVPAFWEDRLTDGRRFRIGDVELAGVKPVPRCVVPTRHPQTGEETEKFRETFLEGRERTFPEWADERDFEDGLFKLMAIARVPKSERRETIRVGDEVCLIEAPAEQ